jgi:DNA-binding transcriptional MerR regulator/mannose-6-phosphate isomerase-like protein (cupin superfamily)
VSPSTLRLWERHGLLVPRRTRTGYRLYDETELARGRDIRRLREIQGLSLTAIRAMLASAGTGTAPLQSWNGHLGPRLAILRRRHGLTLREAGARAGLAPSFISALERTSRGASIASLTKLAGCYSTTVTALTTSPRPRRRRLVRAGARRVLPMLGPGITVEQLAEGPALMDCQRWTLAPGAGSSGAYSHEGEEFIHVLEGQFEIVLDARERCVLGSGDSLYFKSTSTHAWRNPGPGRSVLFWVNTPPTF